MRTLKREGIKRNSMKIFVDGSKRAAVSRMFPVWKSMGHIVVDNPKLADVQLSVIKISNCSGLPTVLRLDGIYYDKAENYNARNSAISISHSTADAVVYQSNPSKKMCEKYLTKRTTKIFDVIYNGVDPNNWNNFEQHEGINIVSCAKWRRHKRLPETIEVFDEFLKVYPGAKLYILGPMKKGAKVIERKNVIYYNPDSKVGFGEIREVYKTCDMYLHLSKKDSCPSSVTEAIAAGMPVITTNACGGATEMCELTEGCIVVSGESESLEPDYIYKDPYNKITDDVKQQILNGMINIVKNKIRVVLPEVLTIEHISKKYIDIFIRVDWKKKFKERINAKTQKRDKSWRRYYSPSEIRHKEISYRIDWILPKVVGNNVLDVGCAEGLLINILSGNNSVKTFTGIDLQQDTLSKAIANNRDNKAFFCQSLAEYLPFKDECFDFVILGEVIEHVKYDDMVIEDVCRVLKRKGRIIITVPYKGTTSRGHLRIFDESTIKLLIDEYFYINELVINYDYKMLFCIAEKRNR